jgi:hypothetical protein
VIKDKIIFGTMLMPLIKRFKREKQKHDDVLSKDQVDIYYERLKWIEQSTLDGAIAFLVDNAKFFPTPQEIKDVCSTLSHEKLKSGRAVLKEVGCPNCHNGVVFYEVPKADRNAMYPGSCAYCHKGEVTIEPYVIQKDDRIYDACEMFMDGSTKRFRANPDIQELYTNAAPLYTNAWLKGYFESKRMGA